MFGNALNVENIGEYISYSKDILNTKKGETSSKYFELFILVNVCYEWSD